MNLIKTHDITLTHDYSTRIRFFRGICLDMQKVQMWEEDGETKQCYSCLLRPACIGASCPKRRFTNQSCPFTDERIEQLVRLYAKYIDI